MSEREWITEPSEVLRMVCNYEIRLVRSLPFGDVNQNRIATWERVPRRLMRHLIGAGLVEPHGLGWGPGSWVYRPTTFGRRFIERVNS